MIKSGACSQPARLALRWHLISPPHWPHLTPEPFLSFFSCIFPARHQRAYCLCKQHHSLRQPATTSPFRSSAAGWLTATTSAASAPSAPCSSQTGSPANSAFRSKRRAMHQQAGSLQHSQQRWPFRQKPSPRRQAPCIPRVITKFLSSHIIKKAFIIIIWHHRKISFPHWSAQLDCAPISSFRPIPSCGTHLITPVREALSVEESPRKVIFLQKDVEIRPPAPVT